MEPEKREMLLKKKESMKIVNLNKRFVCFDIQKRGKIGETLLHLCFLNHYCLYNELAKRLLKFYPKLIYDICISEDYYGQTALHLAIINGNVNMVRLLLLNGADVNERCCGLFFCPDDQLKSRKDSLLSEIPILKLQSNYGGIAYFGEYALSFAALNNQDDCVRILFSKGANPNKQDSNGNTVTHLLVIDDNLVI